jgi:hypothetical protein
VKLIIGKALPNMDVEIQNIKQKAMLTIGGFGMTLTLLSI